MPKQIVVFLDGTGNNGWTDSSKRTNVFKLYQQVEQSTPLVHYLPGIGTDPQPLTNMFRALRAWVRNKCHQGLGIGATERLKDAYHFIAQHYEPDDQIFLFGFSRGAFLAQILAGFLQRVGLLFRHPPPGYTVEQAFWLYWADGDGRLFAHFLRKVMPAGVGTDGIRTHFLGQWDAVESMDIAGMGASSEAWLREIAARERTKPLPQWIGHARHAIALHEVRQPFEPLLWSGVSRKPPRFKSPKLEPQTLKQVWFAGAHADVGGGYASEDGAGTRYSDISLYWMWCQARAAGLPLCAPPCPASPRSDDVPHTPPSLLFGGRPARVRPALAELAAAPREGEYLHSSVLERLWQPIEQAYQQAGNAMRIAWRDADEAAIRFHYRLRFGDSEPPVLAPAGIQAAVGKLEAFLEGESTLSDEALVQYASLALAFKAQLLERYVDRSAYTAVPARRIVAAANALRARFVEPDLTRLWQDWYSQDRTLYHLAMQLRLPEKSLPAPKDTGKI
nr:DUF2235 domain-containing protein [uncultured Massilia sp.]